MGSARSHHTGIIPRARARGFPGAEPSRESVVLRKVSLGKLDCLLMRELTVSHSPIKAIEP